MKKECYSCGYYNGASKRYYKCHTSRCPVYKKPTPKPTFNKLTELNNFILNADQDFNPIMNNKDVTILQFNGWAIQLYKDGKWIVTDTSGG